MAELAGYFGVEKAALTGLMDRAEKRGLAQREPVPGNRRALTVTLTEEGRRAATAFYADVHAELEALVASLTPEGRRHFELAMAEIIERCGGGAC